LDRGPQDRDDEIPEDVAYRGRAFEAACTGSHMPDSGQTDAYFQVLEETLGELRLLVICEVDACDGNAESLVEVKLMKHPRLCRRESRLVRNNFLRFWLQASFSAHSRFLIGLHNEKRVETFMKNERASEYVTLPQLLQMLDKRLTLEVGDSKVNWNPRRLYGWLEDMLHFLHKKTQSGNAYFLRRQRKLQPPFSGAPLGGAEFDLTRSSQLWHVCPDIFSHALHRAWSCQGVPANSLAANVSAFLRSSCDQRSIWGDHSGFISCAGDDATRQTTLRPPTKKSSRKKNGSHQPNQPTATSSQGSSSAAPEDPTKIHPLEAQCIAQEQWATLVEHNSSKATKPDALSRAMPGQVLMLTFSRHKEELELALLSSGPAMTAKIMGIELQPSWAKGAKVFVDNIGPEHFDQDLGPMNVVLHEADEAELFKALEELPWNIKKLKAGVGKSHLPTDLSMIEVSSDDEQEQEDIPDCDYPVAVEVKVKYGFIHIDQPIMTKSDVARSVRTV